MRAIGDLDLHYLLLPSIHSPQQFMERLLDVRSCEEDPLLHKYPLVGLERVEHGDEVGVGLL